MHKLLHLQEKQMNKLLYADYAIAPIQRITRYCLLLKGMQKGEKYCISEI